MPDPVRPTDADDELQRTRRLRGVKIALAVALSLLLVLALLQLESPAPAPAAAPAAETTSEVRQIGSAASSTTSTESLADAAARALRTSEEAAAIQSAALAEQQAMPVNASGVPEESADPLVMPQASSSSLASHSALGRAESSGRLVLGQPPVRSAPAEPATRAPVSAAGAPRTQASSGLAPASPPRFLLQLGVFANHGNAEELRSKLAAAGIPAQIESRVQVGPFATRQEAAAAQEKLRRLGLGEGLLVPRAK